MPTPIETLRECLTFVSEAYESDERITADRWLTTATQIRAPETPDIDVLLLVIADRETNGCDVRALRWLLSALHTTTTDRHAETCLHRARTDVKKHNDT
jgi:hypothetical protein